MQYLCTLVLVLATVWRVDGGSLVIVGGGGTIDPIWLKIIELAGGTANARIGLVTAAAFDPLEDAEYYQDLLENQYGIPEAYWIPVHEGNTAANSDPEVVANTERMTGFFFGGGDQSRITNSFYNDGEESPVLKALKARFTDYDAVVAGTSAGAAVMGSAPMITGGMSYNALMNGAFPEGSGGSDDLTYLPAGGIGVIYDYIVDSHYSERGREGRLIRLIWDTKGMANGVLMGIGVDERTAVAITDANTNSAVAEIVGHYGAMIVDLTQSVEEDRDRFALFDTRITYLTEGDKIALNNHAITYDSWKSNLSGNEYYDTAVTSSNIFDGTRSSSFPEFQRAGRSVFDAKLDTTTYGTTKENNPKFEVFFEQGSESEGWGGYSPSHGGWEISYERLWCDMYEQGSSPVRLRKKIEE